MGDPERPSCGRYNHLVVAENEVCYIHSDQLAAVGCQRCDKPICPSCMKAASVGFHCPKCAKAGAQKVLTPDSLSKRVGVTHVIIAVCVVVFLAQQASPTVTDEGVLWGPYVARGEWWRLITSGFQHQGIMHIGFNMYALYMFGQLLEVGVGRLRFGLIYAGGLAGGGLAVMAFDFQQATLGASGAVLGLAGAMAGIMAAQGRSIFQTGLGPIFAINLLLPLVPGVNISFWGHFGGIAGGFLISTILTRLQHAKGNDKSAAKLATTVAGGVVLALFAAGVVVADAGGLVSLGF